jgi:hypothetical protein
MSKALTDRNTGLVEVRGNVVKPRVGYSLLASQFALASPSSTLMSEYTPAKLDTTPCPTLVEFQVKGPGQPSATTTTFAIATNLPPKPDTNLCRCMMRSLGCIANYETITKASLLDFDVFALSLANPPEKELAQTICSRNTSWCLGPEVNTTQGRYGTFSNCNATERASWMLNQLYINEGKNAAICTSNGGIVQSESQSKTCKPMLAQAGPLGTGVVTIRDVEKESGPGRYGDPKHVLETASIVGIVIGVALFVTIIAVSTICHLRKRKNRVPLPSSAVSSNSEPAGYQGIQTKAELPANSVDQAAKGELSDSQVFELDSQPKVVEVDSQNIVEAAEGETITELEDAPQLVEMEAENVYEKRGPSITVTPPTPHPGSAPLNHI